jgi:hypothetical protein
LLFYLFFFWSELLAGFLFSGYYRYLPSKR